MIWCHHQLEIVAMKRRVHSRTWNRELLHWWKEVHETLWTMASEQTCRIVRPSGCARYRARVFRTTVCVPAEIRLARSGWNWVVSWCFRPFTQGMEAFLLQHTFRTFIHGYITGEIHYEHQVKIWSITAACRSAPGSSDRCTCRFDLSDNLLCIWKRAGWRKSVGHEETCLHLFPSGQPDGNVLERPDIHPPAFYLWIRMDNSISHQAHWRFPPLVFTPADAAPVYTHRYLFMTCNGQLSDIIK